MSRQRTHWHGCEQEHIECALARIAELERKIICCENCGDSWYDSGIASASCPHCRIASLKRKVDDLVNALLTNTMSWR